MNTDVTLIVCTQAGKEALAASSLKRIEMIFMVIERTLTRFDPESELSSLNSSAGRKFKASPLLFEVVQAAIQAAKLTGGIFDPTVLPQLQSAGYDCSFDKLEKEKLSAIVDNGRLYSWSDIELSPETFTIRLPEGCTLDLGGIGKGWAADEVSEILDHFSGYVIDAGGDIRLAGRQANGSRWTVGITDPCDENRNVRVLELKEGAICTSTSARRRWQLNGEQQHHLIDPRT
jgi:thiamine biosynthesis lipoprotein